MKSVDLPSLDVDRYCESPPKCQMLTRPLMAQDQARWHYIAESLAELPLHDECSKNKNTAFLLNDISSVVQLQIIKVHKWIGGGGVGAIPVSRITRLNGRKSK